MTVFDKFADNYDEGHTKAVALSGFTPDYFHEYKLREVLKYLKQNNLTDKSLKLLDFGCGIGRSAAYIKKYLPNFSIYGVDVSKEEIRAAKEANKKLKKVNFADFDGINIPYNVKFDVIFVANVFHHIKRSNHKKVLKNIYSKLAKNGILFIFEHNPINPLTQFIYYKNDHQFDKNSQLLSPLYTRSLLNYAGFSNFKVKYTIFFPQFLSFLIKYEKYLESVPLGAHYYYIAKKD
jgi:SAM-dependent methyltransferase